MSGYMNSVCASKLNESFSVKTHLIDYVHHSFETDKEAFGEIMFVETGKKSTYAPYITVTANGDPQMLWDLFNYYWKLFIPHVIISTVGEFNEFDDQWRRISERSWIFTKGSSPISICRDGACVIAIQNAKSFKGWSQLKSRYRMGLFPARYTRTALDHSSERFLDNHHTHFVFVEGTNDEVADYRQRLLDYIGSRPIEFDSTRTKFIRIPIVVMLIEDSAEELLHSARSAQGNHVIMVWRSAKSFVGLLEKSKMSQRLNKGNEIAEGPKDSTAYVCLRAFLRKYKTDQQRLQVQEFFQELTKFNVRVYPSPNCMSLREAIITALTGSDPCLNQNAIRLALTWNKASMISNYIPEKHMGNDQVFFSSCLYLALIFNRGDFLELLHDSGIKVYNHLTVRMLWDLYYKEVLMSTTPSSSKTVLQQFLKKKKFEPKDLLVQIGKLISELTNFECDNFYKRSTYVFHGARKYKEETSISQNLLVDESGYVEFPIRDLFIWCLFSEHNHLAKILWKHGHEQIAFALLASTIYYAQLKYLWKSAELNLSTEHLQHHANSWEEKAVKFLEISSKANEAALQSQLTLIIPHLGNCSCVTLAYAGYQCSFLEKGPVQRIIDIIWFGSCRTDASSALVLLSAMFPLIIPFTNIIKEQYTFTFFSEQIYRPFFLDCPLVKETTNLESVFVRSNIEPKTKTTVSSSIKAWYKEACKSIKLFYTSPRITFIMYSIFLMITISVMSVSLITMNIYRFRITMELHIWLICYMTGDLFEVVRWIFSLRFNRFFSRFWLWILDSWNAIDILMLFTYFTGLIVYCSSIDQAGWYVSKILLSVTLIFLYIKALKASAVTDLIGPIFQMILRMIGDFVAFIAIVGLLFWSYGVVLYSLENDQLPKNDINQTLTGWNGTFATVFLSFFNFVVRIPFWQIFGNLLGQATDPVVTLSDLITSLLTMVYVCFTTILLLNLLIAMLSYTFQDVKERSCQLWAFFRYKTVLEYSYRPSMPSPLILIEHLMRTIQFFKQKPRHGCPFKIPMSKQELELSREFEKDVLFEYLEKHNENEITEETLNEIKKNQEDMKTQIEEIKHEKQQI